MMNEPDLVAYALGETGWLERRRIEKRLRASESLRNELDQVRATLDLVQEVPPLAVSEELTARALADFRAWRDDRPDLAPRESHRLRLAEVPGYLFDYVRFRSRTSPGFRALTVSTALAIYLLAFVWIAGATAFSTQRRQVTQISVVTEAGPETGLATVPVDRYLPKPEEEIALPDIRPRLEETTPLEDRTLENSERGPEPIDRLDDPARMWQDVRGRENRIRVGRWILFARRSGERRQALLERHGGGADTEQVVATSLEWLTDQQLADGGWSTDAIGDTRITALALLAFLGDGQGLGAGMHRQTVARAIEALLRTQDAAGRFGARVAENAAASESFDVTTQALATQALAECYLLSLRAERLRDPIERAMGAIRAVQNADGGFGRTATQSPSDIAATCRTLSSCWWVRNAGLMSGDERFLDRAGDWLAGALEENPPGLALRAAAFSALDALAPSRALDRPTLAESLARADLPEDPSDVFLLTQAAFRIGGPAWEAWNATLLGALPKREGAGNETDPGAFPAPRTPSPGSLATDPVSATALSVLSLESYYRIPQGTD